MDSADDDLQVLRAVFFSWLKTQFQDFVLSSLRAVPACLLHKISAGSKDPTEGRRTSSSSPQPR